MLPLGGGEVEGSVEWSEVDGMRHPRAEFCAAAVQSFLPLG